MKPKSLQTSVSKRGARAESFLVSFLVRGAEGFRGRGGKGRGRGGEGGEEGVAPSIAVE